MSSPRGSGLMGGAGRTKAVLAAAVGPLLLGYLLVVAVFALVTALASVSHFSVAGVLRASGLGLLAAYQVPVTIGGGTLGVLPLLGTALVFALVARSAARAAAWLGYHDPSQAVHIVAPVAAVHALAGIVIALIDDNSRASAEPLAAFLAPGALSALFATVGVAGRCGFARIARERLDPVALRGLRAGTLGMAGLLAAAALVYALGLVFSFRTMNQLFAANAPGFGSGAGMLLLSIGYLPNALVGTLSFVAGPGFSMGSVSVTPFHFAGGAVPGLPVLAGMPEHQAHWWPVLVLLPAAVGALVGWSLRRTDRDAVTRLRTVAVAGALIGFGCVLLGTLAGGRLANGPFNPVSIPVGLLSLAAFGWIVVPGGLVAWFAGPRREPRTAEAEPAEDFADDDPVDDAVEAEEEEDVEDTFEATDEDAANDAADDEASDEDEAEDEVDDFPEDTAEEDTDEDTTEDTDAEDIAEEADVTSKEPGQAE